MTHTRSLSFGLIGYPLGHSLSPRLHAAALQALDLPGEYRLYPLPPGEGLIPALEELLAAMRRGEVDGLNVTIPHKQAVLPWLNACSAASRAIGAVNTILHRNGDLIGDNTDAPGFLRDLQRAFPELAEPAEAVVLGAGGAARAVAYALVGAGWRVTIAARRMEQAAALIAGLSAEAFETPEARRATRPDLQAVRLDAAGLTTLPRVRLVVNASPVGMSPRVHQDPWPAELPLPDGAALYDLVYNPRQTALMQRAARAGLPVCGGLGMLIEQAAMALERWTGRTVPRQPMWLAVDENRFSTSSFPPKTQEPRYPNDPRDLENIE